MEKLNHYLDAIEDRFAGHPDRPSTILLRALQLDAAGDWRQAHELVQDLPEDQHSAAVHAYLHRKEGDEFNARYWYKRAGRVATRGPITEEWVALVTELLALGGEITAPSPSPSPNDSSQRGYAAAQGASKRSYTS